MMKLDLKLIALAFVLVAAFACQTADTASEIRNNPVAENPAYPAWAKNANIYEVNIRQYTKEGTFRAFADHLPRLQEMGVDILWFMPVFPISQTNRKGTLGSYYAVSDYRAVNPEFGTLEEFRALVHRIHDMGMKAILDWVPNHTGWDHPWITEHPDFYTTDAEGGISVPLNDDGTPTDWTDVADLNYENRDLWEAMTDDLLFWLEEVDVDGYRMDVASMVPLDFWRYCIPQLRAARSDLFMLAEAELPAHRNEELFLMSYGWDFHRLLNEIAAGEAGPEDIDAWLKKDRANFRKGFHMQFITNHDENSWNGTVEERMGPAARAMAVLAFTFDGMPLIYSGQEAGLDKPLEFFEKDEIEWGDVPLQGFYQTLLSLKHRNQALWNGAAGGESQRIKTTRDEHVFAFSREQNGDQVVVFLNLSDQPQDFALKGDQLTGMFNNVFANSTTTLTEKMRMKLNPWDYLVLSNK